MLTLHLKRGSYPRSLSKTGSTFPFPPGPPMTPIHPPRYTCSLMPSVCHASGPGLPRGAPLCVSWPGTGLGRTAGLSPGLTIWRLRTASLSGPVTLPFQQTHSFRQGGMLASWAMVRMQRSDLCAGARHLAATRTVMGNAPPQTPPLGPGKSSGGNTPRTRCLHWRSQHPLLTCQFLSSGLSSSAPNGLWAGGSAW